MCGLTESVDDQRLSFWRIVNLVEDMGPASEVDIILPQKSYAIK